MNFLKRLFTRKKKKKTFYPPLTAYKGGKAFDGSVKAKNN